MSSTHRRQQPAITIRSARAVALLRGLVGPGRTQVEVIEQALEQMAAGRRSLAELLRPKEALDFDWAPPRSTLIASDADLTD